MVKGMMNTLAGRLMLLVALLMGVWISPVQAAPGDLGQSFPITSSGRAPHVGRAADGSIVVTYLANGTGTVDVMAQQMDAAGFAAGAPFRVNTAAAAQREQAQVAVAPDGRFVVIWQEPSGSGFTNNIMARRFNAAGQSQGQPFRVHTLAAVDDSSGTGAIHTFSGSEIAIDANANFITTWFHQDGNGGASTPWTIEGRRWAADGTAQGAEFIVGSGVFGQAAHRGFNHRLVMRGNGEFAVLYNTFDVDNYAAGGRLILRRYNADTTPKSDGQQLASGINLYGHNGRLALAMHPTAGYVAVWDQYLGSGVWGVVLGQRLNEDGSPQGAIFQPFTGGSNDGEKTLDARLDQAGNLVALNSDGTFIKAFYGRPDGSSWVRSLRLIQAPTAGAQVNQVSHRGMAINTNGDALTVYTEAGTSDVRGRFFSLPAEPVVPVALTAPQRVNTYLAGQQTQPVVSVDPAGEKLFGWASSQRDSNPQNAANAGIYAQMFGIDGNPQATGELRQNLLTASGESEPEMLVLRSQLLTQDRLQSVNQNLVMSAWRKLAEDDEGPAGVLARFDGANHEQIPKQQLSIDPASGSPALAYPMLLGDQIIYGAGLRTLAAVAWREGATSGGSVRLRYIISRSGGTQSPPVDRTVAATADSALPTTVDLAMAPLGEAVVVWSGRQAGDTSDQIYAQRFGRDQNAAGSPIRVSTAAATAQRLPKVDMDTAGGFAVTWVNGSTVAVRRFAADGTALGAVVSLGQAPSATVAPGIAVDFDGDYAVAWLEGDSDVVFQAFRRDGEALGGVTSALAGTSLTGPFTGIGIDSNDEGDFPLVWSADAVYERSYSITGDLPLPLMQVNSTSSVSITPNHVSPGTVVTLRPSLNCQGTAAQSLQHLIVPAPVAIRRIIETAPSSDYGASAGWSCTLDGTSTVSCTGSCGTNAVEVTAPSKPGQYLIQVDGESNNAARSEASGTLVVNGPAMGTLTFRFERTSATEGDGTLNLLVDRSGGSDGAVSVSYATANGSATAGSDYAATSGTLDWAASDSQPKAISIPLTPDSTVEGDETFTVKLSNATGGAVAGYPDEVTVTLSDAQVPGSLAFSMPSYSISENGNTATITVNRSGGSSGAASVTYASSNGTATAGQDYTAASGTLNWGGGDATAKTFTVPISNDSSPEADETVTLTLSAATGATLGSPSTATLTITNDDGTGPGTLAFSSSSYAGSEAAAGRMVTVTVNRSGGSTGAASVSYTMANGTATAGQDYLASEAQLNWDAGSAGARTFTVSVLDDSADESAETVQLMLSSATGATLGTPTTATLTIADDDDVPVADTTPDPFTFVDQTGVQTNVEVLSNSITVAGINAAAPISVTGGEYRIGTGNFTSAAGTVANGQTVQVRHTSADALGTTVNTVLTIGGVSDTFSSTTTTVPDTTPDTFSFRDQTGVPANTAITSNAVVIRGINSPTAISVSGTGGSYRIDDGAFVTTAGTVRNGQQVQLRHTSSTLPNQATNTVLTVGGVSDTFTSTTGFLVQADTTPNAFDFTDLTNVALSTLQESNSITVAGINTSTTISVVGGEYSVDAAPYVSYSSTVLNGQVVRVRHTSSANFSTQATTTLTIGGASGSFVSTTQAADSTPNAFTFTDSEAPVEPLAVVVSDAVTITGINTASSVTITGGEYSIGCTAVFTSQAGSINGGQSICVRHSASSVYGAINETVLTIGGVVDRFISRTRDADGVPNSYSFVDRSGVALSTVIVSAPVTITGTEVATRVTVSGGEYSLGCLGGGFTAQPGFLSPGQTICVRHTSSALPATATNTTLTVGGLSDVFTSVTIGSGSADTTPDAYRFTDVSAVVQGAVVTSNTLTITGLSAAAAVQVSSGQYSIGCLAGGFTSAAGTITNNQTLCLRHTAGSGPGITVNTTISIGGVVDVFSSTTAPANSCAANDAPVFETTGQPAAQFDTELSYTLRVRSPTGGSITVNALGLPSCISLLGNGVDPNAYSLSGFVDVGCAAGIFNVRLRAQSASGCTTDLQLPISLLDGEREEVTDFLGRLVRVVTNISQLDNLQSISAATRPISTLPGFSYPQGFFSGRIDDLAAKASGAPRAKLAVGGVAQLTFSLGAEGGNAYVSCGAVSCQELPLLSKTASALTVQLQDGGAGDIDGKADGVITFNGAPALKSVSSGVGSRVDTGSSGGAFGAAWILLLLCSMRLLHGARAQQRRGPVSCRVRPALKILSFLR